MTKGKLELVSFYIEPDYSINVPVEINGQVLKPDFSFWLESGIYEEEEFLKVLDMQNIEEEEMQ